MRQLTLDGQEIDWPPKVPAPPKIVITQTKMKDFRRCRRYYFWRHVENLELKFKAGGRRRGTVWSNALHTARSMATDVGAQFPIEEILDKCLYQIDQEYCSLIERSSTVDGAQECIHECAVMTALFPRYVERFGLMDFPELLYEMPLINPLTNRQSRRFRVAGKVDGIRSDNRGWVIIEDKLTSQITQDMIARLPLDYQVAEYAEALHRRAKERKMQDRQVWVDYRYTRWPGLRRKKDESMTEFTARCQNDIGEREDWYFAQEILLIGEDQMEEHRLNRWQTSQDLLAAHKTGNWYQTTSHCWEYGGCQFLPLCTRRPGSIDFYIKVEDNPELKDHEEEV